MNPLRGKDRAARKAKKFRTLDRRIRRAIKRITRNVGR